MKKKEKFETNRKFRFAFFVFHLLFVNLTLSLYGQPNEFIFMEEPDLKHELTIGLSLTSLPMEIVEEEFSLLPMLEADYKYPVSNNGVLNFHLSTLGILNFVSAGYQLKHYTNGLNFALEANLGYWFGLAKFSGFNAHSMGLQSEYSIGVGLNSGNVNISIKAGVVLHINEVWQIGDLTFNRDGISISGSSLSIGIEQPFVGKQILLGLKINNSKPTYHTFCAYTQNQNFHIFPSVYMGVKL